MIIKTIKNFFAERARKKEQAYQDFLWDVDRKVVDAMNDTYGKYFATRPLKYHPRKIVK